MGLQPHVGPAGGPHRLGVWGRNAGPRPKRDRDASALLVVGLEMRGLRPLRGGRGTAPSLLVEGVYRGRGQRGPAVPVPGQEAQMPRVPSMWPRSPRCAGDTGVSLSLWKRPESKADWDPLPTSLGCCVSVVTTTLPHVSPGPCSRRMGSQGQSRTCTGLGWPSHGRLVLGQSSGARLGSCGCQECPP